MGALVWKHGTSRDEARRLVQEELKQLGHDGRVRWHGDAATVTVGWGAVLSASGRVTDEAVVLDKCGGAIGGLVLERCRELLRRLFPAGESAEPQPTE